MTGQAHTVTNYDRRHSSFHPGTSVHILHSKAAAHGHFDKAGTSHSSNKCPKLSGLAPYYAIRDKLCGRARISRITLWEEVADLLMHLHECMLQKLRKTPQ